MKDVEYAVHSRSSNLYGVVDINDMFQYLGGLSMAVEKVSGKKIELFIAQQKKTGEKQVKGFKMEEITPPKESPSISSSGIRWGAIILVLLLITAFGWGMSKK